MKGRLFNILSALSLLLFVTEAAYLLLLRLASSFLPDFHNIWDVPETWRLALYLLLLAAIMPAMWLNSHVLHVEKRSFNSLSALSLLICIGLIAMWARSYIVSEHIANAVSSGPAWVIRSSGGIIYFDHRSYWVYAPGWTWGRRMAIGTGGVDHEYMRPNGGFRLLGFGAFSGTNYSWPAFRYPGVTPPTNMNDLRWWKDNYSAVSIPYWPLVLISGILPCRRLRSRVSAYRRNRRIAAGLCPTCGYDLRASKERCPECGTAVVVSEGKA